MHSVTNPEKHRFFPRPFPFSACGMSFPSATPSSGCFPHTYSSGGSVTHPDAYLGFTVTNGVQCGVGVTAWSLFACDPRTELQKRGVVVRWVRPPRPPLVRTGLLFLAPCPTVLALLPPGSPDGYLLPTPFAGKSSCAELHIWCAGDSSGKWAAGVLLLGKEGGSQHLSFW